YAQGGVAAALAAPDTPDLHLADTLIAGAGLCDADAVAVLVAEGPERVRELARLGARFDATTDDGDEHDWLLAREGGHTLARVVPVSASRSRRTRRCRRVTASQSRCVPACRAPTSSSCSSTRPRCTSTRCRARCSPRRCAATARSCATTPACRSCKGSIRSPT